MGSNWTYKLPDHDNVKSRCKEYAASLGIDNTPTVRKATAEELKEFEGVKPATGWTEADVYNATTYAKRQKSYRNREFTQKTSTPPRSTIKILKAQGKIYAENRV